MTAPAGPEIAGTLALVGGGEWLPGCEFDAELLSLSGGREVLVLPTAAAYEHPARAVATAEKWFAQLGGVVRGLMVLNHADACDPANAAAVSQAGFVYLSGGSPLHLLSALKGSAVLEAIEAAWHGGAVLAGSSAGAMVLCDPMIDPRGGAYTVGLGLVEQLAVVPHYNADSPSRMWRTFDLAPAGVAVVGIPERTALVRAPGGQWRELGQGRVTVHKNGVSGAAADLTAG
ncbi:MAG TPA: Type 1 glutamine amidotransferase-like domain-containing protein [Acidimicrobiales bacterium]|jgi:cyanophycinase|nr:Type 1 glutamine amidotransferase-like domain-containing protein [Acidimicrobiales bacterium]